MKLIIQIPCFNEEATLEATLAGLPKILAGINNIEYLVIDDGSTDKTVEVAKKLGVHHILSLGTNRGLAAAFREGVQFALAQGADIVVNTDADNQYCGKDVEKLVLPILEKKADMVIGSRPIMNHPEFHPIKKILQILGSAVLRKLSNTNIRDAASGFRAFSKETCSRLFIHSRFSYCMESLIHASSLNLRIVSVDININPKTRQSRLFKNHFQYIYKSAATILSMFILYRPGYFFFSIASLFMGTGIFIGLRFIYMRFILNIYGITHMYVPSLILLAICAVTAIIFYALGVIGMILKSQRRISEENLYLLRKYMHSLPREACEKNTDMLNKTIESIKFNAVNREDLECSH